MNPNATDIAYRRFVDHSLDQLLTAMPAEQGLVELLSHAVEDVPAYAEFLRQQGFEGTIQGPADIGRLPLTNKDNYMRRYPLPQRCRGGRLDHCEMIAVSSGSTGQPMFWPRNLVDELEIAVRFEQVFRDSFNAHQHSTLVIVCFALGNWVGGIYTANCCRLLAQKGYAITLATPGSNIDEIFRVIGELAGNFDQTVLAGYPPFIKGVLDRGRAEHIDWTAYNLRFIFAGEVFSEEWRSLLMDYCGSHQPCHDSASLYGTADAGVLANETPLSLHIRRFFSRQPEAARAVFGESRLPALMQYDPASRFFETHDGTLVVSGNNGVPLLRYHIADKGGILSYDDMLALVRQHGGDPCSGLQQTTLRRLPFVYLFGRADFTVSYYGANIYPENISVAIEQAPLSHWLSGKFVLEVKTDERLNHYLSLAVELLPDTAASDVDPACIASAVVNQLRRLNSEFRAYVPPDQQRIAVALYPHGDPEYFPAGVKHRYTRRRQTGGSS